MLQSNEDERVRGKIKIIIIYRRKEKHTNPSAKDLEKFSEK